MKYREVFMRSATEIFLIVDFVENHDAFENFCADRQPERAAVRF